MNATKTVITNVYHGVPSGNYDGSSLDFVTDPIMASGYYQGYGSVMTVRINVSGFRGTIVAEGSLSDYVDNAIYFRYEDDAFIATSPETGIFVMNIIGNLVWCRFAISDFTAGTINSITVTY